MLRGINVSGQKLIKMDALRKLYEHLGFHNITTYVQSGNVIFTSKNTKPDELAKKIRQHIEKEFGFDVSVIVLSIDLLKKIIDSNPFIKDTSKDKSFLHVTFLSSKPNEFNFKNIEEKKLTGGEIFISDYAVYLHCPNGYGKLKMSNNLLEKKLNVAATTRNWKTTNELLKIAKQKTTLP